MTLDELTKAIAGARTMVRAQNSVVYLGARRRYFTKIAAAKSIAREKLRGSCDCDRGDRETPPYTCSMHSDMERYQRLVGYLAKRLLRNAAIDRAIEGEKA